jgi:hypothetical protein
MARNELDVLLVGGSRQDWWRLAKHLEQLECHCWFAPAAEDVRDLLVQRRFRLILSARPVTEGSNLMELLRTPECTVFYYFPVENGCLWFRALPESIREERLSALRPSEFVSVLREVVASLRDGYRQFPSYDAERRSAGMGGEHRWAASAHV